MKVTTIVIQAVIIMTALSFILMGLAINETDILKTAFQARDTSLRAWRDFLAPYIAGIIEPNN